MGPDADRSHESERQHIPEPKDSTLRGLLIRLDRTNPAPLRRQLEGLLRTAIRDGRLQSGTKLPSSRDLAGQLDVSRGVVVDAYEALAAQGFLQTRDRAAPLVSDHIAPTQTTRDDTTAVTPAQPRFDLTATTPDVSLFDRPAWARALHHALRTAPTSALDYPDLAGTPELRHTLADYLARVRAVAAAPGNLVIVQGFSQAIDLAFRVLSRSGARRVGFEDPSHEEQWEAARRAGLTPFPIPVDTDGIRIDVLTRVDPDAIVVTPAHQFPTGALLSSGRRRELLAWAARRHALVIEDDYDCEFRYDRAPVGALQGLDPNSVLYVGTVSKTLAPALRLGWAVVPPHLTDRYLEAKRYADSGSPTLDQLALARLLTTGAYERAVHKSRSTYRRRRDALLRALGRYLPDCPVCGIAAGLHVMIQLPPGWDEAAVVSTADAHGLSLRPLGDFRLVPPAAPAPALVIGYGRLPEAAVDEAVQNLAAAVWAAEVQNGSPPRFQCG